DLLRELVRVYLRTNKTQLIVKARQEIADWILGEEKAWYQQITDRFNLNVEMVLVKSVQGLQSQLPFEVFVK
ncbi:MAG: hypothetical protein NTV34_21820, partial [Proteobacteria bacterium]|nr:hypothetical protein [Pseudomonadota bacterium]